MDTTLMFVLVLLTCFVLALGVWKLGELLGWRFVIMMAALTGSRFWAERLPLSHVPGEPDDDFWAEVYAAEDGADRHAALWALNAPQGCGPCDPISGAYRGMGPWLDGDALAERQTVR